MGPSTIRAALAIAIAIGATLPTLAQPERITTSDLLKIRHINAIDVAPNAELVVYVVRSIVEEDDGYTYRNDLWSIDLTDSNAEPMLLTSGEHGGSSPSISPDSSTLAFVRAGQDGEDGEDAAQVWTLSLTGPGEARQLTTLKNGASSPQWFPDSASLLVTSAIPESDIEGELPFDYERPRRAFRDAKSDEDDDASPSGDLDSIRRWLANNAEDENPSVITSLDFLGEHALAGEDTYAHLFRIDATTGEHEQLTDGFVSHGQPQISPDGNSIAWVGNPPGDTHPDRWERSSIYMLDIASGESTVLLDDEHKTFGSPRFSENNEQLYLSTTDRPKGPLRWGSQASVASIDLSDGSVELITRSSMAQRAIRVDGNDVYFTEPQHGSVHLRSRQKTRSTATQTSLGGFSTRGVHGVQAYDVANGKIVASVTFPHNPSELYVINGPQRIDPLTNHNSWISEKQLSLPTEHWVESPDGTRVQYWVMEPANRADGTKYPTVLEIHGGPSAMWGPGERSMWHEFQLLASWGYGVVYSNPRGSSGYGFDHQHANYQDWGHGPTADVLAALDDAASNYNWIDTDQLVVTGGSYAGYLTAWIVAHDNRFKAAVAQRGVYDLDVFFGEGNAWRLNPYAMGGYPWDDASEVLERESPFTYVHQIQTPLLIMHASNDLRTGVSQSEMLYRALKVLERPVEYVRYPGAGHDLSRGGDPTQRMDRLNRIVEFFERFVDNDTPAPVDISGDTEE
ncbi:MAG: S9 family peptidase [Planctomycetota bacterium]